jgi:hypothetical protein
VQSCICAGHTLGGAGPHTNIIIIVVLCYTCSVLCLLEQPRVYNPYVLCLEMLLVVVFGSLLLCDSFIRATSGEVRGGKKIIYYFLFHLTYVVFQLYSYKLVDNTKTKNK